MISRWGRWVRRPHVHNIPDVLWPVKLGCADMSCTAPGGVEGGMQGGMGWHSTLVYDAHQYSHPPDPPGPRVA